MLLLLVAVPLSGCLSAPPAPAAADAPPAWWGTDAAPDADCDGVPDDRDARVREVCAERAPTTTRSPTRVSVQFAVATRDPARVDADTLLALADVAPRLTDAFTRATGGRVVAEPAAAPRVVLVPPHVDALSADAAAVARSVFGLPEAPRDVHLLVLVAEDDVPLADAACACVAWHERAQNPSPLGGAFDVTRAFGGGPALLGVTGLATSDEIGGTVPEDELVFRFLHESAHAWCCRLPRADPVAEELLADEGSHWDPRLPAFARDPVAAHTHRAGRAADAWAFHPFTLVAMGAMAPADAPPVRVGDDAWVSAGDVLALSG